MPECRHKNLVLIREASGKLRCRHCHLTLTAEELNNSYCPECYEASGKKRFDFEAITVEQKKTTRYRCEDCGIIIETEATG
jgi:Zn finger protein HypA/HybF involved in hydrogenase expression